MSAGQLQAGSGQPHASGAPRPALALEPLGANTARRLNACLTAEDERVAWRQLCRTMADSPGTAHVWALQVQGRPIGVVAVMLMDPGFAEVGFLVLRPHRGKGWATEAVAMAAELAFSRLGVHRLAAATPASHAAAAAVLERAGFHREGLLRDGCFDGRAYEDCLLYARLADDPRAPS
jgi:RimJ/RimL family protein N-acetyltransferase